MDTDLVQIMIESEKRQTMQKQITHIKVTQMAVAVGGGFARLTIIPISPRAPSTSMATTSTA